jgi:HSP20 family protein
MERLFDTLSGSAGVRRSGVFPAINVSEDAEALYVRAELPGMAADDLEITMENETLTISGERKMPAESKEVSYHRREREWGTFSRSFTLNTRVDADKVLARHKDGVLTITLPKAAEARPRQIAIQAGA